MPTKITVAVGADGEVLRSQMRDGARADRLDSEATGREARKALGDKIDDDAVGRDNKQKKREPVIEPAAHARKKKVEGQFIGLSIQFDHYPLTVKWKQARDYPYMHINVRSITPDGQIKEPVKIELTRNIRTDTFYLEEPDDYIRDRFMAPGYSPGNGPWGLDIWPQNWSGFNFSRQPYTEDVRNKYPITPGGTTEDLQLFASARYNWWEFREPSIGLISVFNGSTSYPVYWVCEYPEQTDTKPDFTGYPDNNLDNTNTRQNGRTEFDAQVTGYTDFHKDPVHELFMLPFTGNKCFLLIVFTDYMIQTATGVLQSCGAQSGTGSTYENISIDGQDQKLFTNSVLFTRESPVYKLPDGLEFDGDMIGPWSESGPSIKITEAGANKIQTIKLYAIEDGVMTAVENIPEQLRTAAGNLSASFKDFSPGPLERFQNFVAKSVLEECVYDTRFVQDFRLQIQRSDGPTTDSFNAIRPNAELTRDADMLNLARTSRKYLQDQAVARSIAKGYGMGKLSSSNHFDSPYIQLQSTSFTDDFYFTPIVYDYLNGSATPSLLYSNAQPAVGPAQFVDYDGEEKVRFTQTQPSTVRTSHSGPYGPWQDAKALKNSTHRCWNWDRPGYCWDKLNALGFGSDLIGTRPADG
jgi:hypothetical protein